MKIKIGGSLSYKIMLKQYEPMDVSTTIEIETDSTEIHQEELERLTANVDKMLKASINSKLELGIRNYKEKVETLRGVLKEI